jgi:hypothetical protein
LEFDMVEGQASFSRFRVIPQLFEEKQIRNCEKHLQLV